MRTSDTSRTSDISRTSAPIRHTNEFLQGGGGAEVLQQQSERVGGVGTQNLLMLQQQLHTHTHTVRIQLRTRFLCPGLEPGSGLVGAEPGYLVRVEQLADGDVDDWFVDDEQLGELVHAESVLRFRNVADTYQKLPVRHKMTASSSRALQRRVAAVMKFSGHVVQLVMGMVIPELVVRLAYVLV